MVVLLCLIASPLMAQEPQITELMSKDLMDFPGKEGLVITVEYAPAGRTLSIYTMRMRFFTCWKAPW